MIASCGGHTLWSMLCARHMVSHSPQAHFLYVIWHEFNGNCRASKNYSSTLKYEAAELPANILTFDENICIILTLKRIFWSRILTLKKSVEDFRRSLWYHGIKMTSWNDRMKLPFKWSIMRCTYNFNFQTCRVHYWHHDKWPLTSLRLIRGWCSLTVCL